MRTAAQAQLQCPLQAVVMCFTPRDAYGDVLGGAHAEAAEPDAEAGEAVGGGPRPAHGARRYTSTGRTQTALAK